MAASDYMRMNSDQIRPYVKKSFYSLGADGFAMLMKHSGETDNQVSPFQPLASPMFDLHKRVKAAFDPKSVLNFGRMHDGI